MENIYSKNGLQAVINASGRMTKLGVSTISQGVGETLVEAAGNYILIDSLYEFAGKKIGEMIGCEDAVLPPAHRQESHFRCVFDLQR